MALSSARSGLLYEQKVQLVSGEAGGLPCFGTMDSVQVFPWPFPLNCKYDVQQCLTVWRLIQKVLFNIFLLIIMPFLFSVVSSAAVGSACANRLAMRLR